MSKQLHFWVDLVVVLVAFLGMVLGIVALTGQVHWPWPVTAVRMTINAVITLILAGKIAEYLRADPPGSDAIGPFVLGAIISLVALILLFATEHMGALSALLLVAFCVMGYVDRLPEKQQEKEQESAPVVIEQKEGN